MDTYDQSIHLVFNTRIRRLYEILDKGDFILLLQLSKAQLKAA